MCLVSEFSLSHSDFSGQRKTQYDIVFLFCGFLFNWHLFFCSISVLCVLKHPRPGEQGGKREQANQSKQRSFYTIMAIKGLTIVQVWRSLITYIIVIGATEACVIMFSESLLICPALWCYLCCFYTE